MTRERSMVPRSEPQSYYGHPVLKEPVWSPEVPLYFFAGGMAGASAGLAFMAHLRGNRELERRAWTVALAGLGASPPLLISDLGRPERFLNMLRMFKVSSPMSVGSWILSAFGGAATIAAGSELTGRYPAIGNLAKPAAAAFGMPLATYTAGLLANTSVPVWSGARLTLPFVFAGGSAASAGAVATMTTDLEHAAPARRLAVGGALVAVGGALTMEMTLGDVGEPYRRGVAGKLSRAAGALNLAGAGLIAARGARSRNAAIAGGALITAGVVAERWAVFRAGFQSAADPKYTVGPQRARVERGETRGAARTGNPTGSAPNPAHFEVSE
jgi:hypothetical protein